MNTKHSKKKPRKFAERKHQGNKAWRVPNPSLANPLIAERAFRASEYWGLSRVSEAHGKLHESVGISNRLLTPATPRLVDRQGTLSATLGLAKGGVRHSPDNIKKKGQGVASCCSFCHPKKPRERHSGKMFRRHVRATRRTFGENQRKTKGQQLKGKIVSAFFHSLFGTFPHIFTLFFRVFQNFSSRTFS